MQKYITLVFFLSIFFFGCGSDSVSPLETLEVNNKEYKMPIVIDNVTVLKSYLERMSSNVQEFDQDDVKVITATFSVTESELFKSVTYKIMKDSNKDFSNLEFSYKFRDLENLNSEVRKTVVQYIANSTEIKL